MVDKELVLYCLKSQIEMTKEVCEECEMYDKCTHSFQDKVFTEAVKLIEQSTENKWTPTTERLPEEDGEYLVYYSQEVDKSIGDECECGYSVEMYDAEQKAFGYWNLVLDSCTLGVVDDEFTSMDTVVAWQPLPKPYRGKKNEKN